MSRNDIWGQRDRRKKKKKKIKNAPAITRRKVGTEPFYTGERPPWLEDELTKEELLEIDRKFREYR